VVVTTEESFYLDGIAKLDGRLLILLDIERALSEQAAEARNATRAVAA